MMPIFLALVPFPQYWSGDNKVICSSGMNTRVDGNIERHFLMGQRILFEKDIVPFQKNMDTKSHQARLKLNFYCKTLFTILPNNN